MRNITMVLAVLFGASCADVPPRVTTGAKVATTDGADTSATDAGNDGKAEVSAEPTTETTEVGDHSPWPETETTNEIGAPEADDGTDNTPIATETDDGETDSNPTPETVEETASDDDGNGSDDGTAPDEDATPETDTEPEVAAEDADTEPDVTTDAEPDADTDDATDADTEPDSNPDGDTAEPEVVVCNCPADDACNAFVCDPATGECQRSILVDAVCDDESQCTTSDHCVEDVDGNGVCTGVLKDCEDGNICTSASCDPATGACQTFLNVAKCDDGNTCTTGDQCDGGICNGTPSPACQCATDADCGQFEDENLCNGTLKCDANECVVSPGTIVECLPSANPCVANSCDAVSGVCVAVNTIAKCDDGNACTKNDSCSEGSCGGEPVACDDGNGCTDESCDKVAGCQYGPTAKSCDDSDPCTSDFCDAPAGNCGHVPNGTCQCQKDADCIALLEFPCIAAICDPTATGWCGAVIKEEGVPCDDGNGCTVVDMCAEEGVCVGVAKDCDDGNVCTNDSCGADGICAHIAIPTDDMNACTLDLCTTENGLMHVQLCTPSADPCVTVTCDPSKGCMLGTNTDPCNDLNPCTVVDMCAEGVCSGVAKDCDDGNVCTADSCNASGECVHAAVSTDDASACTVDSCDSLTGVKHEPQVCPTATCFDAVCDPVTGCGLAPNTDPCEDGKECTTGDTCADGACVSGTVSCDDGNLCTADSCGADGKCVHGGVDVTDGDLCTVDSCDPIAGAQHEPKSCPADPGLDACHVMGCNSTNGQCDPIAGNDGSSCTDVTGCSENATCQSGVCKGTPVILWSANFEGCDAGPMHSGAFEPYTFAIADPVAGQCSYGWLCNGSCPATPGGPTPGQVGYFDVQAPAGGATVYFQWTARTNGYGAWKLTLGLATDEGGFTELSPSASANQWTTASTTFEKGNTHRVILRVISDGSFSGDGSSTPGDGIFVDNLYLVPKNCPAPTP